ncbi:MAG: S8 family serine peptidase [Aeromicrobium sp.]|nr:S8 family serine peptidase [Aeromicrobium sp.]
MSTDTSRDWYVRGHDGTAEWQRGPYTWVELVAFARDGRLARHNTVWHASRPDWVRADALPGLFGQAAAPAQAAPTAQPAPAPQPTQYAPAGQPAPQPAYTPPAGGPPAQPLAAPPRKKRGGVIAIVAGLVVVLLAGAVGAWALFFRNGGGLAGDGPSLGAADTTLPDSASLIATEEWGEVPANELLMVMREGASRKDAEKAAGTFGGQIVGEVEFVDLYQVRFTASTEEQLRAAITAAEANEDVEYAYPVDQVELDAEIWGVRIDPYNDPFYGGGAGDGYNAVGVSKAWAFIKGSGVDLSGVKVGVVDDGIYKRGEGVEHEFGGKVKLEYPNPEAGELPGPKVKNGTVNAAGSHGTAVSTVIGADPDNGGPAGIAGPLGDKLTIAMTNMYGGKYGTTTSTPDPDDPTKQVWYNGQTYSIGALVALKQQIENGATVINCSWGNSDADPKDVETFTRFFTKMAEQHPGVLFVMSGGNGGTEMDGSKRYPSGLALPNMITVGALDNDGKKAEYADWASDDYEITLGAPGTQAVVGLGAGGGPVRQDGSSFAAPHVTAAAAILKSLNPKLTAAEIKAILVATARPGVAATSTDPDAQSQLVPAEMGAGILAIDQAVLTVINDMRSAKGLPPFDEETLEKLGVVDAVAITGDAGEYEVKGIVGATGEKGANLKIEVVAPNSAIGGKSEQSISGAGEVSWSVTLPEDKGTIKVTRLDSGAASLITIEQLDINGTWSGTYTVTDITITDQETAEEQGCSLAIAEALIGKPLPATLDITVDESGQGSGVLTIDASALGEGAEADPNAVTISQSGSQVTITFAEGGINPAVLTVTRSGDTLTMSGGMGGSGPGYTWTASLSFTKPYTPK